MTSVDNGLEVYASNSGLSVKAFCGIIESDQDEFDICAPCDMLLGTVSSLPSEQVTLSLGKKNKDTCLNINVDGRKSNYTMPTLPGNQSMAVRMGENPVVINFGWDVLVGSMAAAFACIDTKFLNEVMKGAHLVVSGSKCIIHGLDSFHGSKCVFNLDKEYPDTEVVITHEVFNILSGLTGVSSVTMEITDRTTKYIAGGITIVATNLVGKYPRVDHFFNVSDTEFTISKAELLDALKRLNMYTDSSKCVLITGKDNGVSIDAEDGYMGLRAEEELMCHNNGFNDSVGVQAKAFINIVGACDSESVSIYYHEKKKPIVVESIGSKINQFFVMMPMNMEKVNRSNG